MRKLYALSSLRLRRSARTSRSSCRYMPWNLLSCWLSAEMAPVEVSANSSARFPLRKSLFSLSASLGCSLSDMWVWWFRVNEWILIRGVSIRLFGSVCLF